MHFALLQAADRVREVHIPRPRGRRLFGWLVSPPVAVERAAPPVLVMHGWGANAAGLAWLRLQPGIAADRLVLLGHSVGAAAALLHASLGRYGLRHVRRVWMG